MHILTHGQIPIPMAVVRQCNQVRSYALAKQEDAQSTAPPETDYSDVHTSDMGDTDQDDDEDSDSATTTTTTICSAFSNFNLQDLD